MDELLDNIINNEKEWRKHIIKELNYLRKENKELRKDLQSFKIKVAGFGAFFIASIEGLKLLLSR